MSLMGGLGEMASQGELGSQGKPASQGELGSQGKPASQGELTVTREQVRSVVSAERSWDVAAQRLGIRPGLAFMVATGIPADGSGVPELSGRVDGGPNLSSPQSLVNPRGHNPLRNELVEAWVHGRASRELS